MLDIRLSKLAMDVLNATLVGERTRDTVLDDCQSPFWRVSVAALRLCTLQY
jgi:hypothetical protein